MPSGFDFKKRPAGMKRRQIMKREDYGITRLDIFVSHMKLGKENEQKGKREKKM